MFLFIIICLSALSRASSTGCDTEDLDAPIAFRDGDYLIAGIFNIGTVKERREISESGSLVDVEYCSRDGASVYGIQKALMLREVVEKYTEKFKQFDLKVGYIIYDSCKSFEVTTRISVLISTNDKVIGVSSVDRKDLMKRSADITASMGIPTFIYMFNDHQMMDENQYRTLFSMIETEETEAKITINFLKEMGYTYVDIWYHKFSKEMATFIYEDYVRKVGCGHFAEVTYPDHIPRIPETFAKTGGHSSEVQLILSNSLSTTKKILNYMTTELGFTKKIYILGVSNGRTKFLKEYVPILQSSNDFSIVMPLAPLLNADLGTLKMRLTSNWTSSKDDLDDMYKNIQLRHCPLIEIDGQSVMSCKWTGWLPYVVSGTNALVQSLLRALKNDSNLNLCSNRLRSVIFNSIIEENRVITVQINENLDLDISFENKSVNIDYDFGVYRAQAKSYDIVGHGHRDGIRITEPDVMKQVQYEKFCSPTCQPGQYRLYDERIAHLPCCWTCTQCANHSITVGYNENSCDSCRIEEISDENHTSCFTAELRYITSSSNEFLGAVPVIFIGSIAVIITAVVIFRNEQRPIIKASDPGYMYMVLFGLFTGIAASFMPLLKPSTWTCSFEYILVIICCTIVTTNLLWRCIKIYGIFIAANSFRKPFCESLFKRTGQTWLNIGTFAIALLFILIDLFTANGLGWRSYEKQIFEHSHRYLVCQGSADMSMAVTALPLVIPVIYFIATLILAFKMRRFPHNFKETLNIFGATLVVALCCIMFLSGYNLSHLYLRALLRSIVIFVTSTAFLVCLFVPKIVLLIKKVTDIEVEREQIKAAVRKFASKP